MARKKVTSVPPGAAGVPVTSFGEPLNQDQKEYAIRLILLNEYRRTGRVLHSLVVSLRGSGFTVAMVELVKVRLRQSGDLPGEGEIQLHRED